MKERILIVDDEALMREPLADYLEVQGYGVSQAHNLADARGHLQKGTTDLVLLDLTLPDGSGMSLLEQLNKHETAPTVVVLTGNPDPRCAVDALRGGAADYVLKPFPLSGLNERIYQALAMRARRLSGTQDRAPAAPVGPDEGHGWITPRAKAMVALMQRARRMARLADHPILVTGESGVGKEYVCRMLHQWRDTRGGRFVAGNCAELEPGLLRSDLFGHERGAFTGAVARKPGLFEMAAHGTLLLDEIGELSPQVQAALLRVLEDGTYRRVGGAQDLQCTARIVAATHRNLHQMAEQGRFRKDLLYRLDTLVLHVPPLRERPEDIADLAHHFAARLSHRLPRPITLSPSAVAALTAHPWPGNIRRLRGVVERSVLRADTPRLTADDLDWGPAAPPGAQQPHVQQDTAIPDTARSEAPLLLEAAMNRHIEHVVRLMNGNHSAAARVLGISRSTLTRRLVRG